jgi:hypothetical protein
MTSASKSEPQGGGADCTSVSEIYGVLCERKGRHFGHSHEAQVSARFRAVWAQ